MVMAHEIAHVLHRDPVAAMGGGVASSLALLGLTGNAGTGAAGSLLNNAGMLTSVQFTRKMEVQADRAALQALHTTYGHVFGASRLFEIFKIHRGGATDSKPGWFERFASTHPVDDDRINRIATMSAENGWAMQGEVTPLPEDFLVWLSR